MKAICCDAREVRGLIDGTVWMLVRPIEPMRSQREWLSGDMLHMCRDATCVMGEDGLWAAFTHPLGGPATSIKCPFGQPGDRLWVREPWSMGGNGPFYTNQSDGTVHVAWNPAAQMPQKFSRLTLTITAVRPVRVRQIAEDEIRALGIIPDMVDSGGSDPSGRWIEVPDYHAPLSEMLDTRYRRRGLRMADNWWAWLVGVEVVQ